MQTGNTIFDGAENDKRIRDIASCVALSLPTRRGDAACPATDIRIRSQNHSALYTKIINNIPQRQSIVSVKFFSILQ